MYTKITKTKVQSDYDKLKDYAKKCYEKNKYAQSLCAIETASKLMYTFNMFYTDDEMETMLSNIASPILNGMKTKRKKSNKKRIIFYDFFAIDNRGITQQYLTALIELGYEILFITYEQNNMKKCEEIFKQLNQYENAQIYTIKSRDYVKRARELYEIVNDFGASKVLLHTSPWDVVGILTFSYFRGIERYLINLTDHTFWIGKCCSDYILEFRSYGYNISRNYRNIPEEKLILLPYYPIQKLDIPFEGFPFDAAGKKVIFSGGSVYKIYGSNVFFDTVKYIVEKHQDTVVIYAGGGNTEYFESFIASNKLTDRVFLIKERKDISQIFKNCYFYLGTYPISGGLMTQYAVANKKIPVAFSDEKLKSNFIEPLFIKDSDKIVTYTNLKDYYAMIDKLIEDPKYKNNIENNLENLIITKTGFAENLLSSLKNKCTKFSFEKDDIDINKFSDLYFEMENNYLHNYYLVFASSKNIILLLKFMNIHILNVLIKLALNKFRKKFAKKS